VDCEKTSVGVTKTIIERRSSKSLFIRCTNFYMSA
jgi:hypothetical protein